MQRPRPSVSPHLQLSVQLQHLVLQWTTLQAALILLLATVCLGIQARHDDTAHYAQMIMMQVLDRQAQRAPVERAWWKRPRSGDFWNAFINRTWESEQERDREFRQAFRMSYAAFERLCELLRPALERDPAVLRVRHAILDVRQIVACVLYRLASGDHLYSVSHMFGLARGTISVLTREVCAAINLHVRPLFLRLPSTEGEVRLVLQGFEAKSGLPNCFGALDSTHVKLAFKPARRYFPGDFWSEHKQAYTVVMQAVVDSKGRFMDIDVRWPGRASDSHIYRSSMFFNVFPQMYAGFATEIEGVHVPLYVVADSAYPLSRFCMKKFCSGPLQQDSQYYSFDVAVSSARVAVENAFSRCKGRWRCLEFLKMHVRYAPAVISACAALHNFVELFDPDSPVMDARDDTPDPQAAPDEQGDNTGAFVRNALLRYMSGDSAASAGHA
jgi:hypothetical protein